MFRRRKYLIKRGLQLRYLWLILFGMVCTGLLAGLFIYLQVLSSIVYEFSEAKLAQKIETAQRMNQYEQARYRLPEEPALSLFKQARLLSAYEKSVILDILRRTNLRLIPSIIILLLIVSVGSVFISHRIAGPLYRLERLVAQIKGGDLTVRFKLRPKDELKGLANALDDMARSLQATISDAAKLADQIRQASGSALPEAKKAEMLEQITRLVEVLSHFKVEGKRA